MVVNGTGFGGILRDGVYVPLAEGCGEGTGGVYVVKEGECVFVEQGVCLFPLSVPDTARSRCFYLA